MMERKLRQTLSAVTLPEASRRRILQTMPEKKRRSTLRPALLAAVLALCITLPLGAAALGGEGFFKDVKNIFGAVTGTEYENATEEIAVTAQRMGNTLLIHVALLVPEKAPYPYISLLSLHDYELLNADGKVVKEGDTVQALPMEDTAVTFSLPLPEDAASIRIHSFLGSGQKGDQPLPIYGSWQCQIP